MKVTVKGKEYTISNDEIKAGDLVYNRNAHVVVGLHLELNIIKKL
jgi:hypothetical protein